MDYTHVGSASSDRQLQADEFCERSVNICVVAFQLSVLWKIT
jgi:hypothetical protein